MAPSASHPSLLCVAHLHVKSDSHTVTSSSLLRRLLVRLQELTEVVVSAWLRPKWVLPSFIRHCLSVLFFPFLFLSFVRFLSLFVFCFYEDSVFSRVFLLVFFLLLFFCRVFFRYLPVYVVSFLFVIIFSFIYLLFISSDSSDICFPFFLYIFIEWMNFLYLLSLLFLLLSIFLWIFFYLYVIAFSLTLLFVRNFSILSMVLFYVSLPSSLPFMLSESSFPFFFFFLRILPYIFHRLFVYLVSLMAFCSPVYLIFHLIHCLLVCLIFRLFCSSVWFLGCLSALPYVCRSDSSLVLFFFIALSLWSSLHLSMFFSSIRQFFFFSVLFLVVYVPVSPTRIVCLFVSM